MNTTTSPANITYAAHAAQADVLAKRLERVAYRLRQGAISETSAIAELAAISVELTK